MTSAPTPPPTGAQPRWETVLFDLDGTLADTIPLIVASYQHAFRTVLAEEVEEARARAWIGRPLLPALLEESPEHGHELDRVYREWNLANTARLIRRYAGVPELLAALAAAGVTLRGRHLQAAGDRPARAGWPSASTTSSTSSPAWRTPRATSRRPTRCCTPPRRSASSRPTASTSATPPSTCSPPGPPGWPRSPSPGARASARRWRPPARTPWSTPSPTSRRTCSVGRGT